MRERENFLSVTSMAAYVPCALRTCLAVHTTDRHAPFISPTHTPAAVYWDLQNLLSLKHEKQLAGLAWHAWHVWHAHTSLLPCLPPMLRRALLAPTQEKATVCLAQEPSSNMYIGVLFGAEATFTPFPNCVL